MNPSRRRWALAACAIVALLAGLAAAAGSLLGPEQARAGGVAGVGRAAPVIDFVQVEGVLDPPVSRYLLRELDSAARTGADLIVVQVNSPGGLDAPVGEIVRRILASKVPVVTWVSPSGARAASAGLVVALAGSVTATAPGATLDPTRPANLGLGGVGTASDPTAGLLRAIGQARDRSPGWAGQVLRHRGPVTAGEAVREGMVDFVAGAPATLLQKLDGRTAKAGGQPQTLETGRYRLRFHKLGVMERLLHTALRPEIAYFLLVFGLFGLIFEVYNPGVGAAGLTGGICLAFSFYALTVLPTRWGGVALLVAAVALFLVEMHEAGLGLFTVLGLVAFVGGSALLFRGADPALRLNWIVIAAAVASMLLFFISVMTAAIRSRASVPAAGSPSMTGTLGEARTDIAPDGQVFANGTLWRARTAGMAIPEGATVTVLGVSGLLLIVERAEAVTTRD